MKLKMSKNRDISYARLIKKIQQTTKELTATKNGQSIFKSQMLKGAPQPVLSSIDEDQQQNTKLSQSSKILPLNTVTTLQTIPENDRVFRSTGMTAPNIKTSPERTMTGPGSNRQIPLLVREDLKKDFMKILELKGPKYPQQPVVFGKSTIAPEDNISTIQSVTERGGRRVAPSESVEALERVQAMQPPIGMTARMSPKGLRYRFYYPEF